MPLFAIVMQGMALIGLLLFSLVPSDSHVGSMLIWSREDVQSVAERAGAHWAGLQGPLGTHIVTGSAQSLHDQGAFALLNFETLAILCGAYA